MPSNWPIAWWWSITRRRGAKAGRRPETRWRRPIALWRISGRWSIARWRSVTRQSSRLRPTGRRRPIGKVWWLWAISWRAISRWRRPVSWAWGGMATRMRRLVWHGAAERGRRVAEFCGCERGGLAARRACTPLARRSTRSMQWVGMRWASPRIGRTAGRLRWGRRRWARPRGSGIAVLPLLRHHSKRQVLVAGCGGEARWPGGAL